MKIVTNKWFIVFLINWVINILVVEFLALRKIKNIINVDEKRDSKYKAFRRLDTFWFNRPWLFMTCHLNILKYCTAIFFLLLCGLFSIIITFGIKDKPITGIRYFLCHASQALTSVVVLFCCSSCLWVFNYRP